MATYKITADIIKNTPKIVDYMLDEVVTMDSRIKLRKRLEKVCNLATQALEQEPKTGHWIVHERNGISYLECSECLRWYLEAHLLSNSYCPNCGSNMIEPREREEKE